jgi:hypothetical protein
VLRGELAELENYRAYKTEVPEQVAIVHVSPSASQPEQVAKVERARQVSKRAICGCVHSKPSRWVP